MASALQRSKLRKKLRWSKVASVWWNSCLLFLTSSTYELIFFPISCAQVGCPRACRFDGNHEYWFVLPWFGFVICWRRLYFSKIVRGDWLGIGHVGGCPPTNGSWFHGSERRKGSYAKPTPSETCISRWDNSRNFGKDRPHKWWGCTITDWISNICELRRMLANS